MMENYDRTMELVEVAQNSAGKSSEQFAKYSDTLEYKINKLKNSWEQLRVSFLDSNFFKNALDKANDLMQGITEMDASQFLKIGIVGITLGKLVISNFISSVQTGFSTQAKGFKAVKGTFTTSFGNIIKALNADLKFSFNTELLNKAQQALRAAGVEEDKNTRRAQRLTLEYQNQEQELSRLRIQLQEHQNQANEIEQEMESAEESARAAAQERLDQQREILNTIQQQTDALEQQHQRTRERIQGATGINPNSIAPIDTSNNNSDNNPNSRLNRAMNVAGSAISEGLLSAIAVGLTTTFAGGDLGDTFKAAGLAFAASAAPTIMSALSAALQQPLETGIRFIGGKIIGLITAIGASFAIAIAAIVAAGAIAISIWQDSVKAAKAAEKAENERYKNLEKTNKELQQQAQQAASESKQAKSNQEKLNKTRERYLQLQNKGFRNQKEQEEFEGLYETLTSDYSEVVDIIDENTQQLKFNEIALNSLNETYTKEIEEKKKEAISANNQIINNAMFAYQKRTEAVSDVQESGQFFIGHYSNDEGYLDTERTSNGYVGLEKKYEKLRKDFAILGKEAYENILPDFNFQKQSYAEFTQELEKAGLTYQDFINQVTESSKELVNSESLTTEARTAAAESYKIMDIDGLDMTDELAEFLASSIQITEESIDKYESQFIKEDKLSKSTLKDLQIGDFSSTELNKEQIEVITKELEKQNLEITDLFTGWDGNLIAYENLPDYIREFAKTIGYDDASSWNDIRKSATESGRVIKQLFNYLLSQGTTVIGEQLSDEAMQDNADIFNDYSDLISNLQTTSLNESEQTIESLQNRLKQSIEQIDKQMEAGGLTQEELDILESDKLILEQLSESIKEKYDTLVSALQQDIETIFGTGDNANYLKSLDKGLIENIINQIKSLNLTTGTSSELANALVDFTKDVGSEAAQVLSSIPFNESYASIMASADDYIKAIQATGVSLGTATDMFYSIIEKVYGIIGKIGFGSEQAEIAVNTMFEQVKGFKEEYDILVNAQKEFLENGKLTSETYWALQEAGFEDYINITSDGYTLLADKAESFMVKSAMQPYEDLKNSIKEQEVGLKRVTQLFGTSDQHIDKILENISNANDPEERQKLIDDLTKSPKGRYNYTDEQLDLLSKIAQAGYSSISEALTAGNDYLDELIKSQSDMYIASLENLNSEYEQVQEKVSDLQKELADLNEELEDNKKAIDDAVGGIKDAEEALADANEQLEEANQQLQEAIHGTDDFKSSLDGLTNYTTKLKDVDNAIEDIKDSLEKVNDIDEATGLFGELNSSYDSKVANLTAQNRVIDDALANLQNTLISNYGQYINFDSSGAAQVNFAYMYMNANDELKSAFEEEYNLYEEYRDKQRENNKAIKELEDERREYRKQALDDYVGLQEKVIDLLKQQAQEEVDITKEKYDAMAEADDDYLDALEDAINKQRDLRNQEKEWNDLATKEKKLSLMQRDTSGANAKEVANLEKDIEDNREKLLDESIDNVVDNLKELYEQQKEARELEIEYMEEVTENAQYFNEWAQSIMANWTNSDEMIGWFMENNPDTKDMTVEQTEQYMMELEDEYGAYATYAALLKTNMQSDAQSVAEQVNLLYNNVSENISNIGTVTQATAQQAADDSVAAANEAINAAHEAIAAAQEQMDKAQETYQDAINKMNSTQDKILETQQALSDAEKLAVSTHEAAMREMKKASLSEMNEVAVYAMKQIIELSGKDITDSVNVQEIAQKMGWMDANGQVSRTYFQAVSDLGGDTTGLSVRDNRYKLWVDPNGPAPAFIQGIYNSEDEANNAANKYNDNEYKTNIEKVYKTGGIVDYTGPAWVDGTPSRPEAFLNASDTVRIGEAARLLSELPIFNNSGYLSNVPANIGDTSIEININVENISDDYSVDQMIERVRQDIVDVSQPIGSSVILSK